mmetsp:Transcript_30211/g.101865  ORF Transcript_30211/g.101865 Transcript_30211/m.101865 type:complete len:294 (+) Transcript_30211:118-999(+)
MMAVRVVLLSACASALVSTPRSTAHRAVAVRAAPASVVPPASAQWGVRLEDATSMRAAGYRMNAVDNAYEVETIDGINLRKSPGLGIQLEELANNGEGVGVVVVAGLVEGSPAASSTLRVGDVISEVGDGTGQFTSTEAKPYDDVIAALVGAGDNVNLVVKRLVARPKVAVTLKFPNDEDPEQMIEIYAGENLRKALLVRGVKLNDQLARRFDNQMQSGGDCGAEGTCCTCAVAVMNGAEFLTAAKTQEEQMLRPTPRWRLACKARVGMGMEPGQVGQLVIRVSPRQHQGSGP